MKNYSITAVIVDDEPACISRLVNDLKKFPEIEVIGTTTDTDKARNIIIKEQPDILFLDVEMPQISGTELLQSIRTEVHPGICVVFYSAFDKYMIDALRASAFDFLLKPYQHEELKLIIERAEFKLEQNQQHFEQSMRRLLSNDRKFAIQAVTGLLMLKQSEILCFQFLSDCHCWQMTSNDRKQYKLRNSTTAKELLNISNSFVQTSQDCILNLDFLIGIENKTLRCILPPQFQGINITVSRRYFGKIREILEMI